MPFIEIPGAVSPYPPSYTDRRGRAAALGKWISIIAREVGRKFQTKTERDAVESFVRGHRLSIANAFERKLVSKDVVDALTAMFKQRKDNE